MRASVDKSDRGYGVLPNPYKCKIFKDGYSLSHCITADEELGLAIVHKMDEQGRYVLNAAKDDVQREYVIGRIDIIQNEGITD